MSQDPKLLRIGSVINRVGRLSPRLAGLIALNIFIRPKRAPIRSESAAFLDGAELLYTGFDYHLAGFRWGPREARPRVLLVHGWESHSGRWVTLIERLLAAGAQVFAFDGPAAGRSGGRKTPYNTYVDAALAFERAHGPFDAYVGHSFGGGVVVQLMHRVAPTRRPESAVVMASFDETEHVFDRYFGMLGIDARVRADFDARVERLVGGDTGVRDYSNTAALRGLGLVRGLVVHSRDDAVSPYGEGERLHAAWPASTLLTADDAGHGLRDGRVERAVVEWVSDFLMTDEC